MKSLDDPLDRKALIFESYRIDGITVAECRSIFLDWALSLSHGQDTQDAIAHCLGIYQADFPDHPMTEVLRQGQEASARPRRRGGWKARQRE